MSPTATTTTIQLTVTFEDGDITKKPTITNSTDQVDTIPATSSSITWHLKDGLKLEDDGLTLTGIDFFSDKAKTIPIQPTYFRMPGANGRNRKWFVIDFNNSNVSSEKTIYYTVNYKDDDFGALSWDPKLKIAPRVTNH